MQETHTMFWTLLGAGYFFGQTGYVVIKYKLYTRAMRKRAAAMFTAKEAA